MEIRYKYQDKDKVITFVIESDEKCYNVHDEFEGKDKDGNTKIIRSASQYYSNLEHCFYDLLDRRIKTIDKKTISEFLYEFRKLKKEIQELFQLKLGSL